MNKVMLLGNVCKDLELKTYGETSVVKFSLAVQRRFKKDETDFINCTVFGKTAEIMSQYCNKGSKIVVCGRIQTGSYEKEGQRVYTTDVIVEEFHFAGGKKQGDAKEPTQGNNEGFYPIDEDDEILPF